MTIIRSLLILVLPTHNNIFTAFNARVLMEVSSSAICVWCQAYPELHSLTDS